MRPARREDVSSVVALCEERRRRYEKVLPTFWRKARDSEALHARFVDSLVERDDMVFLVHDRDGAVDGAVIAQLMNAPPVYDPGGPTCTIDDFVVAAPELWETVGRRLLDEAGRRAKERGAVQVVVICADHDEPKRRLLAGMRVASSWYVADL